MAKQKWLSIAAVLAGFLVSYLFDILVRAFSLYSARTMQLAVPFAARMAVELLFAAMMAFLFWLIVIRYAKSNLTGGLLIALGMVAFALASPYLLFSASQANNSTVLFTRTSNLPFLQSTLIYLSGKAFFFTRSLTPFGYLSKAAALTIAIGVVDLLRKSH